MDFNFENEMIYGKKHMNKLNFNKEKYNFVKIVENLFNKKLNELHIDAKNNYDLLGHDMLGKDSHTEYHKKFYNKLNSGWPELVNLYNNFVNDIILPYLGLSEALYQTYPTFRVQLPNNVAVVIEHYDSDSNHNHPVGEINFILALTDMYDTNTVWVEKKSRFKDFIPLIQSVNDCTCFNGNTCTHFNKINMTGKTRVSFDFRILPLNYYNCNHSKKSVTTNQKYIEGQYYKKMKISNDKIFNPRDIWDKEKEKFNSTLLKYNINCAWGIVDLFEKKIAKYAGSKYAISVDCCTNALFLCLKYLKAKGNITIPKRTWISVPNTIINSGCNVNFEDIKWSGIYRLKPYPIYDSAVRMKKNMYIKDTYYCLSFHIRKHIPIGRGGMILTDNKDAYDWFRKVRYCGRTIDKDGINYVLYKNDNISSAGWNMYMTPEQAARGLELFKNIKDNNADQESSGSCKDLSLLPMYTEEKYYTYNYWFNNEEEHKCWDNGGENYYGNHFYQEIIFKLDIPKSGYIVVLGTHNCMGLEKLCKYFGKERVIGYDLHNPKNHPNVIIKDCNTLSENMEIAFLHNDLGSFTTTPKLKLHGYKWASKNMIKGGYILGNNNLNRGKVKIEELLKKNNFNNIYLRDLDKKKFNLDQLSKKEIHNGREFCALDGYMLSKKL